MSIQVHPRVDTREQALGMFGDASQCPYLIDARLVDHECKKDPLQDVVR